MIEHDVHNPLSRMNATEAAFLSLKRNMPACQHCDDRRELIPMQGTGWGVQTFHEDACPLHEDNQPAAEWGGDDDADR